MPGRAIRCCDAAPPISAFRCAETRAAYHSQRPHRIKPCSPGFARPGRSGSVVRQFHKEPHDAIHRVARRCDPRPRPGLWFDHIRAQVVDQGKLCILDGLGLRCSASLCPPVALALATAAGRTSGRDVLTAIIACQEVGTRVGNAATLALVPARLPCARHLRRVRAAATAEASWRYRLSGCITRWVSRGRWARG
jgi:hypothetical protein